MDDSAVNLVGAVGPGSVTETPSAQSSLLDGVTEYEYVDIYNPLSVTFQARVSSSRPVNAPVKVHQTQGFQSGVRTESDLASVYGLSGFKNTTHPSLMHIAHPINIGPGQTRRLAGNEAQVVLRQLVGYLLQVEGKSLKLADPYERGLAEERIVRGRGNMQDIMDSMPQTIPQQFASAVEKSNQSLNEVPNEPEFPEVAGATPGRGEDPTPDSGDTQARRGGRPKVQR